MVNSATEFLFSNPLFWRIIIASIAISIISGVLGCFIIWRKMSYFGDSLSHSALLGVAIALLGNFNINLIVIITGLIFALILLFLQQKKTLTIDSLFAIISFSALSFGMVIMGFLPNDLDLESYLFGDITKIEWRDIYLIYTVAILLLIIVIRNWSALLLMTISEDLARSSGVNICKMNLLFMFLVALTITISINWVGILLITAMLIIPAATARQLTKSPESMTLVAVILGIIANISGIYTSLNYNIDSGPTIIVSATMIFVIILTISSFMDKA